MTARDYVRALREGWIIILVCTLVGLAVGAALTLTRPAAYESTSTLAVSTCVALENSSVCDPVGGMSFAIQRARIYASTIDNLPVQRRALELTNVTNDRRELRKHVAANQLPDSPIVTVTASWPDAKDAAKLSNAVAQALVEYARGSIDNFESDLATVQFSIVSEASAPAAPVATQPNAIAVAGLLGLMIGTALALTRYFTRPTIRYADEVEHLSELMILDELEAREIEGESAELRFVTAMLLSRARKTSANRIAIVSPHDGGIVEHLTTVLAESSRLQPASVAIDAALHGPAADNALGLREATPRVSAELAVLRRSEGVAIATNADAIVLVVILGETTRAQLKEALRTLALIESNVLGAIAVKA